MFGHLTPFIDRLANHRVLVVGDPVLDVYLNGFTDRVSREAPVLIVQEESRDLRLGGAANTAANLTSLGASVTLVGLVGADADGAALDRLVGSAGIDGRLVTRSVGATIAKTRVMAGGLHTRKQQMLRIDRENRIPPPPETLDSLLKAVRDAMIDTAAVVISDYGDPALTDLYVALAQDAQADGRVVIVDSRRALLRFEGVTAVTPNEPEVEALLGRRLSSADEAVAAARILTERLGVEATLLTRGREGMAIVSRNGEAELIAAVGGEAVDVTGAGDTVTAAFTLGLLAEAPVADAARLANLAAAVTVQTVGAAVCTPKQLADAAGSA